MSYFAPNAGSNGTVTFNNVIPGDQRNRPYVLRAIGVSTDEKRSIVRRSVRPGMHINFEQKLMLNTFIFLCFIYSHL